MADDKGRYVTIFESHPLPVFILDKDSNIIAFNLTAKTYLDSVGFEDKTSGYAINESAQLDHQAKYASGTDMPAQEQTNIKELLPWLVEDLKNFISSQVTLISVEKNVLMQNEKKSFHVRLSRIIDVSEKFSGVVITLEDITEQKQLQLQKEELLAELKSSNEELQEYAHIVSHDLKSPLRSISALATWLKEDHGETLGSEGSVHLDMMQEKIEDFNWKNQLQYKGKRNKNIRKPFKHERLKYKIFTFIKHYILFSPGLCEFKNYILLKR